MGLKWPDWIQRALKVERFVHISKLNSICRMAGSAIVAVLLVSWEMHGGSNSWDPTAV